MSAPQALPWHATTLTDVLADRASMHHALLLTGSKGIGKGQFALALAAALLCERPGVAGHACGECPSCHWLGQGNHPDFRAIIPDAATDDDEEPEVATTKKKEKRSEWIKISQIRAAQEFVALSSHRGGRKVIVINPADALQPAAANALLKTLEEPPPATTLVLVSHQSARLLPTVRSRCRKVPMLGPALDTAAAWLGAQGVNDAVALAALARGAPLAALAMAEADAGQARRVLVAELAKAGGVDVLGAAARLDKQPMDATLYLVVTWVCDLLAAHSHGPVAFHIEHKSAIERAVRNLDVDQTFRFYAALLQARRLAQHPLNARLFLEQLLISYSRCFTQSVV